MQLRVVGAHLPKLDPQAIESFIANDTAEFKAIMCQLIEEGKRAWSPEDIEERLLEVARSLRSELNTCALFEVEVVGNTNHFYASDFASVTTGFCGWEPAYLTLDGQTIITGNSSVPPEEDSFRVAFYIHEWSESERLAGPTGELAIPPLTAVPERLWRLAPYACLD